MKINPVIDHASREAFLEVPKILYKNDPNWTCLLDVEVNKIFDPEKNDCYKHGEAERWFLKDDQGKLIGRIAAFYDDRKKDHSYVTAGNVGFFDCVNDQKAANLLFDTAKEWLQSKGLKAMDGNSNFGENFFHWGTLVEGFQAQGIGMPYNFPYYKELFENYGFKDYFQQLGYCKKLSDPWPERQYKFAEFLSTRPDYKFVQLKFSEMDKFMNDFVETYNNIWSDFHEEYTPLKLEEIKRIFDDVREILDEELIWFAYSTTENRPIGMAIGVPDVNIILRKLKNGKLTLWNKLKLLYYLKIRKNTANRCRVIMSGVVPEYQQKGVIAVIFLKLIKTITDRGFTELELSWTGDYNKPVLQIYEHIGAKHATTHITYRYIFDNSIEFKRFTNEEGYKARKKPVNK